MDKYLKRFLTDFSKNKKMKRLISALIVTTLLSTQLLHAQINLEHTFDGYVSPNYEYVNPIINYYVESMNFSTSNQIKIYKEDYTLYKSVSITPPTSYAPSQTYSFSKNIFTTDDKITFLVMFVKDGSTDNTRSILRLYNEDGAMIKDFGNAYIFSPSIHLTSSNKYRLLVLKYLFGGSTFTYKTEIYSVPGAPPPPPPPPVPPTITTTTLPDGMVGIEYNATLTATGDEPIVWSLGSGNLPTGLELSSDGVISGMPTEKETFDFTVEATNNAGNAAQDLSIFIDEETGIAGLQMAALKIFPNPTNGALIVDGGAMAQNRVTFYDMTGKEVLNQDITGRTELNISTLQKGVYIVTVVSGGEVVGNFKVVRQ